LQGSDNEYQQFFLGRALQDFFVWHEVQDF
jgi:hypothetical protein